MLTISIIILLISILIFCVGVHNITHTHEINENIDKQNQELEREHQRITENVNIVKNNLFKETQNYNDLKQKVSTAQQELLSTRNHLNDIQNTVTKTVDSQKELSQKAFENYCEVLEKQYEDYEKEYDNYKNKLEESYSNKQLELMRELDETQKDLDKIKATRTAAIQAQLKEKEIKENKDNFRLNISEIALRDIRLLKSIQKEISNPIVINKIIWSNYYQPLAKAKFPKIIGKDTACGIYKITNLITEESYIGQSLDICDRWKQHCKNALEVNTTNNNLNKLYKSMKENGLSNFSFEIIEECSAKELNEKEKFYIDLYNTYNFGLNSNRGNQ